MQTKVISYNAATSAPVPRSTYTYPAPSGRVVASPKRATKVTSSGAPKVRMVVGKTVKSKVHKTSR